MILLWIKPRPPRLETGYDTAVVRKNCFMCETNYYWILNILTLDCNFILIAESDGYEYRSASLCGLGIESCLSP